MNLSTPVRHTHIITETCNRNWVREKPELPAVVWACENSLHSDYTSPANLSNTKAQTFTCVLPSRETNLEKENSKRPCDKDNVFYSIHSFQNRQFCILPFWNELAFQKKKKKVLCYVTGNLSLQNWNKKFWFCKEWKVWGQPEYLSSPEWCLRGLIRFFIFHSR